MNRGGMGRWFFGIFAVLTVSFASAHEHKDGDSCEHYLGRVDVITRGARTDEGNAFEAAAQLIQRIAHERGWQAPDHKLYLAPGRELNILALTNGPAPTHFLEGLKIYRGIMGGHLGTLEFATMGGTAGACSTCRSFYMADLSLDKNIPILAHVAGHNHHFVTSVYHQQAPSDVIASSREMADKLETYYKTLGHEKVALFYQFLNSFGVDSMDLATGAVDLPEELDPSLTQEKAVETPSAQPPQASGSLYGQPPVRKASGPRWTKTYSVLQALKYFLPAHAPEEFKDLVRLHELRNRIYPGNAQTQFKNEGIATFSMYHLLREVPEWQDTKFSVEFAQLIGVANPTTNIQGRVLPHAPPTALLSIPYFLGYQAWARLYEKFEAAHPEIKNLPAKDQLNRFMSEVDPKTHHMNDMEFLKFSLDETWWNRNPVFLARPATDEEVANTPPQKFRGEGKSYYIVTSRDRERLLRYWTRHIWAKHRVPRVAQLHPALSNGEIHYDHTDQEHRPLIPQTVALTLFARSVYNQSIRMKTWVSSLMFRAPEPQGNDWDDFGGWGMPKPKPKPPEPKSLPITYIVSPNGDVRIISEALSPEVIKMMEEALHQQVMAYREDVYDSFSPQLMAMEDRKWEGLVAKIVDHNISNITKLASFAPSSAGALHELALMMKKRLAKKMAGIASGQVPVRQTQGGVAVNIFPIEPHFQFDEGHIQAVNDILPPAPLDRPEKGATPYNVDDGSGTLISVGDYLVGDLLPAPEGGSGGQGSSAGKGEPNEQLRDLVIPIEIFGAMLDKDFGLPNIRKTDGEIERLGTVRRGAVHKHNGPELWDRMAVEALAKANAVRAAKGQENLNTPNPSKPRDQLAREIMKEGLAMVTPADKIVPGRMPHMLPYFDAVVTMALDLTGSMSEDKIKLARDTAFNYEAALKAKYPKVHIRYVVFQTTAQEVSRSDFYGKKGDGGTSYQAMFAKVREVFADYPYAKFNHYLTVFGDGEIFGEESVTIPKELQELMKTTQYMAFAITDPYAGQRTNPLVPVLERFRSTFPWLGIAMVTNPGDAAQAIIKLLPGEQHRP